MRKYVGFQKVIKDIFKIVNFIKSKALNHTELQKFLNVIDAEHDEHGNLFYRSSLV